MIMLAYPLLNDMVNRWNSCIVLVVSVDDVCAVVWLVRIVY